MEIYKSFKVDAAHYLPNVPCGHKCGKMHGHTFKISVHVTGSVDSKAGWIVDFGDISNAFAPIAGLLDHACLNDIEGLDNPCTSQKLNTCSFFKLWSRDSRESVQADRAMQGRDWNALSL